MRRAAPILAGLAFLLTGCGEGSPSGTGLRGFLGPSEGIAAQRKTLRPLTKLSLAGGDVVVAGPDGYCIDPKSRKSGAERGFAALASCLIMTGGRAGAPVEPVLMTVTVGPKGDPADLPTPELLAGMLGAPLRAGEARDGLVLANLARGGDAALDGGDAWHWRGAFVQNGRVIGLALYAPKDSAMAGRAGGRLLRQLRARIVAVSPKAHKVAAADTAQKARPKRRGLVARLLDP